MIYKLLAAPMILIGSYCIYLVFTGRYTTSDLQLILTFSSLCFIFSGMLGVWYCAKLLERSLRVKPPQPPPIYQDYTKPIQ